MSRFDRVRDPASGAASYLPRMDLLEYQGKQLFAKHGVPVPEGRHATTVEEAVKAADEVGYPVVIKAQVQIGGRGKAGGIKLARPRARGAGEARAGLRGGNPGLPGPRGWGGQGGGYAEGDY